MGKIAYLTGAWPMWSETFIRQELELLLAAGLPLVPLALYTAPGPPPAQPPVITLEPLRDAGRRPTISLGTGWIPHLLRRQLSLLKNAPLVGRLLATLQAHDVTHVHAAFASLPALLAALAARRLKLGYSVSAHARDVFCGPSEDRYVLGQAAFVHCCNQAVLDELQRRSPWLAPRLHLIRHGLCLDAWPWLPGADRHEPLSLLFVGRFTEKKDPVAAVRLVGALVAAGLPVRLRLVGEGPLRPAVATAASGLPVELLPPVSRDDVRRHLQDADFLLFPSRQTSDGDRDGIPNTVLEAMATGLPVLATRAGSLGEIVTDATAWTIDPADTDGFVRLVQYLRANPAEARARAVAARRLIEQQYEARQLIRRKVELLRQAWAPPAG